MKRKWFLKCCSYNAVTPPIKHIRESGGNSFIFSPLALLYIFLAVIMCIDSIYLPLLHWNFIQCIERSLISTSFSSGFRFLKNINLASIIQQIGDNEYEILANPEDRSVTIEETWRAMEELVKEGYTRSIGLSNFNSQQIERILKIATIKPVVNQVDKCGIKKFEIWFQVNTNFKYFTGIRLNAMFIWVKKSWEISAKRETLWPWLTVRFMLPEDCIVKVTV